MKNKTEQGVLLIYDHGAEPVRELIKEALKEGAAKLGMRTIVQNPSVYKADCYMKADAAIVFGVTTRTLEVVRDQLKHEGKPIVVELGYVRRGTGLNSYWSIGLFQDEKLCNFKAKGAPRDRWNDLRVELQPWKEQVEDAYILVCGQVPGDANLKGMNPYTWARQTISMIRGYTDRQIVFRPHPEAYFEAEEFEGCAVSTDPLHEDLENAHAVVVHSSNSAVEAVIRGVPVFVLDESMASPVANKDLATIQNPDRPDRQQWANELAYSQWSYAEMKAGFPLQHLLTEVAGFTPSDPDTEDSDGAPTTTSKRGKKAQKEE